jgi:hypothetical protein
MNQPPDRNQLLDDVLAEGSSQELRETLLAATLHLARRRRSIRGARNAGCVVATLCFFGILAWKNPHPKAAPSQQPTRGYEIVETRALPLMSIVKTRPLEQGRVASQSRVAEVHTTGGGFQTIDDTALFAFLAPRPVFLVSIGLDSEVLVFGNKADQLEILLN